MINVILVCVLAALAGAIILFLAGAKKRGETCIGCPYSKSCSGKCACSSDRTK